MSRKDERNVILQNDPSKLLQTIKTAPARTQRKPGESGLFSEEPNPTQENYPCLRARSTSLKSHLLTNEPSNANKTMPAPEPTSSRNATRRRPAHFALTAILQFHAQSSICALADGLSAHRQRAHLHLQLALRPPQRRHDDPAHRRHRCRAQYRSIAQFHLRRPALARSRLGRAVPAVASASRCIEQLAEAILDEGSRVSRFHAARRRRNREAAHAAGPGSSIPGMREISREESDRRAAAGEPFVLRFRVPRDTGASSHLSRRSSTASSPKPTDDIEDFALLRSDGMPTYHLASCADDADLRISHIIRGQDHLTNTFKHVLIFRGRRRRRRRNFAHLPLLIAPDGTKLSKRKHGPVCQRHHVSRRRLSAAGVHQFPVPAGLVAQERSRADDPPGTDRRVLARRREPQQRRGQLHRGRSLRPEGRLAERRAHPHHAASRAHRTSCCRSCQGAGFDVDRRRCRRSRR